VLVTRDAGAVPRYELKASLTRAAEYRQAVAAAEARCSAEWSSVADLLADQRRGVYLERAQFDRINRARRGPMFIRKARLARTHKGRLTILAGILPAPVAAPCIACGAPEDAHDKGCSIGEKMEAKRG